ncbi:hypothetical protein [Azospirillum sp. TSO35-2]|uniref:hypothetical protein n=1 Tax=Azospirillum sp. TSO35-2 TaxID=716796 RepID=UPI000D65AB23|nr:hypothetical protein [Azospirillum sp. TSO35-2]
MKRVLFASVAMIASMTAGLALADSSKPGWPPVPMNGGNAAYIDQIGDLNSNAQTQYGKANLSDNWQKGSRNAVVTYQDGTLNRAFVNQNGDRNYANQLQDGTANLAKVDQSDAGNTAYQKQFGIDNDASVVQSGFDGHFGWGMNAGNFASQYQDGVMNEAKIAQKGMVNTAYQTQMSNGNLAIANQTGVANYSTQTQR